MQRAALTQDFQEIEHIGMHLTAQGAIHNAHALLLAQRHIGQQAAEIRLLIKARLQGLQLLKNFLGNALFRAQGIQAVAVFSAKVCHCCSPTFLMNSSTKPS